MERINSILFIYLILFSTISSLPHGQRKLASLTLDSSNWSYDSTNNVYYQIGVTYCTNPASTTYETLGIYVPGEYMTCTQGTSTYTCSINSSGTKGSYTAKNAPFVMPVNTSGYSAMTAPTSYSYSTVSTFLEKGIIYIYAGCRGRYEGTETSDSYYAGAPWGVTDLKAAIRFLRYNSASIPGDLERFYTFGHSGGGAQSCLMGITGNSELFNDYLNDIGAAMEDASGNEIKDNIKGSQCWCPITNLDTADAAYEWNMGQYASTGTRASGTFTKILSDDLVEEYVKYINNIKLKDPNGKELTLTSTNAGTYYDYLKSVIEESLNNFLADTTFPYTPSSDSSGGGPGGSGSAPSGSAPSGSAPSGSAPSGSAPSGDPPSRLRNLETYQNVSEYISSLNSDEQWITYNSTTGNYSISSVEAFVTHCKSASKDVGAFDDLSKSQAENKLFGISYSTYTKHFDRIMANLLTNKSSTYSSLTNWDSSYPSDYANDLSVTDKLGKTISYRVNMYNPMYYIHSYYDGYQSSDVADYFRINTGITQGDTSSVVEMNLFLALTNYGKNVAFTTVWNQGHTEAERSGDAEDNFISWIAGIEGVNDTTTDTTASTSSTTSDTSSPTSSPTSSSTSSSTTATSTSSYDYSSYSGTSSNTNLSGQAVSSTTSGESAVYITQSGITISDSTITKSGDISSSNTEDSEFYGINAAVLVQGGGLTMTGGSITTSARGGNALVATNGGTVTISGTTVTSTGSASARGLHATYGGTITANNVTVSSTGGSCATLATDRGEGTVSCTGCTLSTGGSGSPLIYSTGDITVTNTTGTASAAQAVVVEGKNSATIKSSNLKCTASPNNRNDGCGALIYQSQSGDADTGTSSFTCDSSTMEILESSSYYSSSPMFYITNTAANIALTGCTFTFGSGQFLVADEGSWGSSGSNGGTVTLTLTNQNIEGDIIVGNSSSLTVELVNSTIKGSINPNKTATKLAITLDSASTLTLTGNSYYTSLSNANSAGSNIVTGSYTWNSYEETSSGDSGGSGGSGSGTTPSSDSGGSPPGGSDGGPQGGSDGGPPGGSDGGPQGGSDGGPPGGSDGPQGGSDGGPGGMGSDQGPNQSGAPPDMSDSTSSEVSNTDNTQATNGTSETTSTANETSIVLLGFSNYEAKDTSFSFYIFFVSVLNRIYSPTLTFPMILSYNSLLRALDENVNGNCTLVDSTAPTNKVQYSCDVAASTSNIKQIKIDPTFTFGNQSNVSLVGITPLATTFLNDIQNVGTGLNLSNATIYVLDHSIYNKYDTYSFNVTGIMTGESQPSFGKANNNLTLTVNTASSGTKEVNCTITGITGSNYTLDCRANETFEPVLQSSYSSIGNEILLINFDAITNSTNGTSGTDTTGASDTTSTTNPTAKMRRKTSGGLSGGTIAAIVVCPVVAIGAMIAVIYFLKAGSAPNPHMTESTKQYINTQNL